MKVTWAKVLALFIASGTAVVSAAWTLARAAVEEHKKTEEVFRQEHTGVHHQLDQRLEAIHDDVHTVLDKVMGYEVVGRDLRHEEMFSPPTSPHEHAPEPAP